MSMNFGGINQSSATGTRPYVSDCPLKIVPKLLLLAETMLTTMSS